MTDQNIPPIDDDKFFSFSEECLELAYTLLKEFNSRKFQLRSLPPFKRISIFFLTRVVKTFSAIQLLCFKGYGQDTSTLLRSLLENLISVKYVLSDNKSADLKATRFVEYKWVIFKRYIAESDETRIEIKDTLRKELLSKKELITQKVVEFKSKNKIISDKALITWSGRSVRDMAKMVSSSLLKEYDSTFRLSSRFSHPSIIGDREYLDYKENTMVFSSLPSPIGVHINLEAAVRYLIDFLETFNDLFELAHQNKIKTLKENFNRILSTPPQNPKSNDKSVSITKIENPILKFKT